MEAVGNAAEGRSTADAAPRSVRAGRRNRGRRRRVLVAGLVLMTLGAVATLSLASGGSYRRYPRSALIGPVKGPHVPPWTRPCWALAPYVVGKPYCVEAKGRVVWVQDHDPDGDGDRHLVVMARLRVRIVKLTVALPVRKTPRIGSSIVAVGWLMRGASGREEIDAQKLVSGGRTYLTKPARTTA